MVKKAVADECAAKGPADSPDPAPTPHTEAPRPPDPPNPLPPSLSAAKIVQEILTILKQSTIVRPDQDVRSRFWKLFKTESEEFHADFIKKYGDELDISLIFVSIPLIAPDHFGLSQPFPS